LQEVKKVRLTFKKPKSDKSKSITITTTLAKELKKLYKQQLEYKLLLGKEYQDLDLVFVKRMENQYNQLKCTDTIVRLLKLVDCLI
jgi:hypothetical protein